MPNSVPTTSTSKDILADVAKATSQGRNTSAASEVEKAQFAAFSASGAEYESAIGAANTGDLVADYIDKISREDTPPQAVSPWECRLGGSRFFVPPISMKVSQSFQAGALSSGALRQQSSPKFNSGHSETVIEMTVYFPSADSIWGFDGARLNVDFDKADDEVIDRFLASLRGLIAQFKYAPFLPVKNAYLNGTYGITGVVMKGMTIQTIEGFPFCLAAVLTLYKFNHKVYLPMVNHFEDAVHWGKYRQFCGRAAQRLQALADKDFLIKDSPEKVKEPPPTVRIMGTEIVFKDPEGLVKFDKVKDFQGGKDFDLFVPAHTPGRQALPDLSGFSKPGDVEAFQKEKNWWQKLVGMVGLDINTNPDAKYENVSQYPGDKTYANENRLLQVWAKRVGLTVTQMDSGAFNEFLAHLRKSELRAGATQSEKDEVERRGRAAWFSQMYTSLLNDTKLQNFLAYQEYRRGDLIIQEWEVPMVQVGLNPDKVFVQQVAVTLGNNVARLQLQLQDEPVHQHIGGMDTKIQMSLLIFGEEDLLRLRTMFDHLQGIARLEHGHAVLGFLGIKNVITALVGTRYCIPDFFESDSIPGYPHVYRVNMSFLDFDVFQQKREALSHEQQAELIEAFTKRNPFLRVKQHWKSFSAYPDFPLGVRDDSGKLVGHLDPDWYFKQFETVDKDITSWRKDKEAGVGLDNKVVHHMGRLSGDGKMQSVEVHGGGINIKDGKDFVAQNLSYNEPHAGNVLVNSDTPGLVPPSGYMQPYVDGTGDPTATFDKMMDDTRFRNKYGRMIRAFPTYMLWLIDEGGVFAGVKLFDNFYGLQSVIDFSIVRSEEIMADTLVLRISNLYGRLSTKYRDLIDEDIYKGAGARIINTQINRNRNLVSGLTDTVVQLDTIQLKPGVRVHLRCGYSSNPSALETVFNGTITEVQTGDVMTVVAQSDAVELAAVVNNSNKSGHSGKLDGCFPPYTPLNLWDGGTITIGDIVKNKLNPILTGLDDFGNVVPCQVTGWFDNGVKDEWLDLQLSCRSTSGARGLSVSKNVLRVTPNHQIYINGRFISSDQIRPGDSVLTTQKRPSESVLHLVRSSLLGDGAVCWHNRKREFVLECAKYQERHTDKHEEYNKAIQFWLGECGGEPRGCITGYGFPATQISSKDYPAFAELREEWYPNGVKIVPEDLSWVDDWTVAKWYMDDGSLVHVGRKTNSAVFSTNGFTEKDVERLGLLLDKLYGVLTTVYFDRGWNLRVKVGKNQEIGKFWEAISPYVIPGMRYKLPVGYREVEYKEYPYGREEIVPQKAKVTSVSVVDPTPQRKQGGGAKRKGFDITTTSNNYFARGVLVHNSLMSGFWLSEPRDLMVRLLGMGSSTFREQIAHATRGTIFSENRFGIRHFGHILYEPLSKVEEDLHEKRGKRLEGEIAGFASLNPVKVLGSVFNFFSTGIFDITNSLWVNFSRKRDYELYKRNIYPGNGTGVGQYLGGDLGDGGLATSLIGTGVNADGAVAADINTGEVLPSPDPRQVLGKARGLVAASNKEDILSREETPLTQVQGGRERAKAALGGGEGAKEKHPILQALGIASKGDDDARGFDEVSFRAQTYMKSIWDLFQLCAALLPNYIVAVRPFEDRSTVFYGKPHWMYTSGVIPLSFGIQPDHAPALMEPDSELLDFVKGAEALVAKRETPDGVYNRMSSLVPEIAAAGGDPTASTAGVPWGDGDIQALKLTHTNGAVIPKRSGKACIEMHLPTDADLSADIRKHKTDYPLPKTLQHPYYMDRVGGPSGGYTSTNKTDNPGETDTVLKENALAGGKNGAFGFLDPDVEQWYMNQRWTAATGKGYANYRGRKILIYNDRTKKAVISAPGEYGPHGDTGRVAGMSPECWIALGSTTSDEHWFGFVDDTTPLGPVQFTSGATFKGSGFPSVGAVNVSKVTPKTEVSPPSSGNQYMPGWLKERAHKEVTDPRLYSLQFGHGESRVPVNYTDPEHMLYDTAGAAAAEVYSEDKSEGEANEIWDEFRKHFAGEGHTKQVFQQHYPNASAKYEEVVTNFMQFMWQHPYHRGWIVRTAEAQTDLARGITEGALGLAGLGFVPAVGDDLVEGAGDFASGVAGAVFNPIDTTKSLFKNPLGTVGKVLGIGGSGDEKHWNFNRSHQLWQQYIVNGNVAAIEWMKSNASPGKKRRDLLGRAYEEFHRRVVDKIFNVLKNVVKAVGGALTGILSILRLSLLTLTQGLSLAGYMQKQANALNRAFNDSIYYNAGPPGSLLYLADNAFTREYGEPVVEVREPFQRVHFLSSFTHIIKNGIIENTTDVATVITATSNGGKPVTVHFDKGASAEKQVEKNVETGLAWDKPKGIIDTITNPTKIIRTMTKAFANGNDETSAKRVALYHLRESLKNIYKGEILILGDPSIRPHDLIYLSDAYEKIYGMVECEQVVHHFTPEGGFVTAVTPNAIVTVNDPYRWTMGSITRAKWANWNIRHDLRQVLGDKGGLNFGGNGLGLLNDPAGLGIVGGRNLPGGAKYDEVTAKELATSLDAQIKGTVQYTGGLSAVIKDIQSASVVGGFGVGAGTGIVAGLGGAAAGTAGLVAGGAGLLAGGLVWKAFNYVKENLLDQHGAYISYLTKDGQPMDAGLSYNHGVAVGQQHVVTLFKNSLNLHLSVNDTKTGESTISLNRLLGDIGWKPQEINELISDTDLFVQETRVQIMRAAGRDFERSTLVPFAPPIVKYVLVTGAINGHTIEIADKAFAPNGVRLASITAPTFLARAIGSSSDPGIASRDYAASRLVGKKVALRINRTDPNNKFGQVVAWVFHSGADTLSETPGSSGISLREQFLTDAAGKFPAVEWDSYHTTGLPYTYNWEAVLAGVATVDINSLNRSIPNEGVLRGSP